MSLVAEVLAYGTFGLNIGFVLALVVYAYNRFSDEGLNRFDSYSNLIDFIGNYALELAFLQASIATLGSLYMSNILKWAPCRLCWFQRIFMYPLVLILGLTLALGFLTRRGLIDFSGYIESKYHVILISLTGLFIAGYHAITQRYSQFHAAGCSITQVSCETKYTFYFGYVTVPVMAFTAFLVVLVLLWRFYER